MFGVAESFDGMEMNGGGSKRVRSVRAMDEQLGGSNVGSGVQVSMLYTTSFLAKVIVGALKDDYRGLRLGRRRTSITGRPMFWRASMNEVNASTVSRFQKCVSSCSSGNGSRGSSPSSDRRQRDSSLTSPSST